MFRRMLIPVLVGLFLVQMAFPHCMVMAGGLVHGAAGNGGGAISEPVRPDTDGDRSDTDGDRSDTDGDRSDEVCWVEASHLFKKALTPGSGGEPVVPWLALSFVVVIALVPRERPYVASRWFLPDRSPPRQPLLQVFRI